MAFVSHLAKRALIAWALMVSLALGPALGLSFATAMAAESGPCLSIPSSAQGCHCNDGGCAQMKDCVSHCVQAIGQAIETPRLLHPVLASPSTSIESAMRSLSPSPGLDPPQA